MQVELVSPQMILFSGEATAVSARTTGGEIQFLAGHAPFLGTLDDAEVRIETATGVTRAQVHGGFVEVKDNTVILLSDDAELTP